MGGGIIFWFVPVLTSVDLSMLISKLMYYFHRDRTEKNSAKLRPEHSYIKYRAVLPPKTFQSVSKQELARSRREGRGKDRREPSNIL